MSNSFVPVVIAIVLLNVPSTQYCAVPLVSWVDVYSYSILYSPPTAATASNGVLFVNTTAPLEPLPPPVPLAKISHWAVSN